MAIFCRETYAVTLLERKAAAKRKETDDPTFRSKMHLGLTPKALFIRSIVRPIKMLIFSPIVLMLSLYMALIYGYLYLLFTTISGVFENVYGFSQGTVGLAFLGIGVGLFLGLAAAGGSSDYVLKKMTARNGGVHKPEFRLPLILPAAVCIPVGLFIYGWTARASVHWFVPIFGTSFVGFGMIASFVSLSYLQVSWLTIY